MKYKRILSSVLDGKDLRFHHHHHRMTSSLHEIASG